MVHLLVLMLTGCICHHDTSIWSSELNWDDPMWQWIVTVLEGFGVSESWSGSFKARYFVASAEAKPEWIQRVPGLNEYQDMLLNKAKFLAESKGRGLEAQQIPADFGWLTGWVVQSWSKSVGFESWGEGIDLINHHQSLSTTWTLNWYFNLRPVHIRAQFGARRATFYFDWVLAIQAFFLKLEHFLPPVGCMFPSGLKMCPWYPLVCFSCALMRSWIGLSAKMPALR